MDGLNCPAPVEKCQIMLTRPVWHLLCLNPFKPLLFFYKYRPLPTAIIYIQYLNQFPVPGHAYNGYYEY